MPQLGETVTEGKVAAWFKSVGEHVAAGENLFEIETDKVTMEVQATESGILAEIRVAAGATVPVGTVLAVLGGAVAAPRAKARRLAMEQRLPRPMRSRPVRTPARSFGGADGPLGLKVTPLARRLAAEGGLDLAAIAAAVQTQAAAGASPRPMCSAAPRDRQCPRPPPSQGTAATPPRCTAASARRPRSRSPKPGARSRMCSRRWRSISPRSSACARRPGTRIRRAPRRRLDLSAFHRARRLPRDRRVSPRSTPHSSATASCCIATSISASPSISRMRG